MQDIQISVTELLKSLVEKHKNDKYATIEEIIKTLHERGFGLLMILFSFPMAIPLPYPPGFTTILGTPLLFFAVQMLLGMKAPWLPKWVSRQKIKISHLSWAVEKSHKYFHKAETSMKPRYLILTSPIGEKIIGVFSVLCAISVVLPIWLGNSVPSAGILVMSLGLLSRDGLIVLIGMVISVIGLIISATVVILGAKAVKAILSYIPGVGAFISSFEMESFPSWQEIKDFLLFWK